MSMVTQSIKGDDELGNFESKPHNLNMAFQ